MWRIIWTGVAVLLVAGVAIVGACGRGEGPAVPPRPTYEAPPVEEMLALGEAAAVGGIEFTVVGYITLTEIKGQTPLETGFQYLLVRYEVENTTGAVLAPPYIDENLLIIHPGGASGIPSLIFTPLVPLPDGSSANHYTYRSHFSGELDGGASHNGWECYLVPLGFAIADTYVRWTLGSGEQVFWSLGKS